MATTISSVTNPITDFSATNAPPAVIAPANTNLTQSTASQNLSAVPTIASLEQAIADINQNAYLSAPGMKESLATIQDELAGKLAPSTIYANQLANAQQYGAGGFSSDSPAWNTAIARGLGIDTQNLVTAGQNALDSFYAGLPKVNAQTQLATPELTQSQAATAGQQAIAEQQVQNQASQHATDTALKAADQYAALYGNIPGYNQYGIYTGQIGNYNPTTTSPMPTTPTFALPNNLSLPPFNTGMGTTTAATSPAAATASTPVPVEQFLGGVQISPTGGPGSWSWLQGQNAINNLNAGW